MKVGDGNVVVDRGSFGSGWLVMCSLDLCGGDGVGWSCGCGGGCFVLFPVGDLE